MDRKIIGVMLTLVVVLIVVMAVVLIALGGGLRGHPSGFTALFDDLQNPTGETQGEILALPTDWHASDVKSVSDTIVDLFYESQSLGSTTVYVTTLYFVYIGDKWTSPSEEGSDFYVPTVSGYMHVHHGLFRIDVSSATNLSAEFQPGDAIELRSVLTTNLASQVVFGQWTVADTL